MHETRFLNAHNTVHVKATLSLRKQDLWARHQAARVDRWRKTVFDTQEATTTTTKHLIGKMQQEVLPLNTIFSKQTFVRSVSRRLPCMSSSAFIVFRKTSHAGMLSNALACSHSRTEAEREDFCRQKALRIWIFFNLTKIVLQTSFKHNLHQNFAPINSLNRAHMWANSFAFWAWDMLSLNCGCAECTNAWQGQTFSVNSWGRHVIGQQILFFFGDYSCPTVS